MPAAPLQVLIVGCGNIAGGLDRDRPVDELPFTHAGGYARNPAFALAACVDPDADKRAAFMVRWGVRHGFVTTAEALAAGRYDVVSVCSPTAAHADDLAAIVEADARPRLVFCEKPATTSASDTALLADRYAKAGVQLAVNYTRRFDPVVASLAAELRSGAWGAIRSVAGVYGKGLLNNGSHMLDLLHLLLGPLSLQLVGTPVHDFWPDDPSIPVVLAGPGGTPISLSCGHANDYALFELQIVTERGVVAMEEGGLRWRLRRAEESATFAGYRALGPSEERRGGIAEAMMRALAEITAAVNGDGPLSSTAANALAAQRLCEAIQAATRSVPAVGAPRQPNGRAS